MFRRMGALLSALLILALLTGGLAEEIAAFELPEFELAPEAGEALVAAPAEAGETATCGHLEADWQVTYKPWYSIGKTYHRRDAEVSDKLYCSACGKWVTLDDLDAEAVYAAHRKEMEEMAALYAEVSQVPDSMLTSQEQEAVRMMNRLVRAYQAGAADFTRCLYEEARKAAMVAFETGLHSFNSEGVCVCGAKLSDVATYVSGNAKLTVKLGEPLQIALKGATPKGWKAKSGKIVKLSGDGHIEGLKEGKTTVTITLTNKKKWKLTVTVVDPYKPTKIGINELSPMALKVGDRVRLTTWLKPATAQTTYNWKSSKPKVASVSSDGVVTAKKAGTAKITVTTRNGKKATIVIRVKK